jgi:hypothetical protein
MGYIVIGFMLWLAAKGKLKDWADLVNKKA